MSGRSPVKVCECTEDGASAGKKDKRKPERDAPEGVGHFDLDGDAVGVIAGSDVRMNDSITNHECLSKRANRADDQS